MLILTGWIVLGLICWLALSLGVGIVMGKAIKRAAAIASPPQEAATWGMPPTDMPTTCPVSSALMSDPECTYSIHGDTYQQAPASKESNWLS